MYTINDLYDLTHTLAGDYLARFTYPWEALSDLADCIRALGAQLDSEYLPFGPEVWVHRTAHVAPTASITGPCIIGPETEVRHCAFIRGSALVGAHCVVGNSVELKNVILFDNVQTPHYNYVGDSILGYKAHMGAGSITSNVKSDKTKVHPAASSDGEAGYIRCPRCGAPCRRRASTSAAATLPPSADREEEKWVNISARTASGARPM